jgi:hypothetical protein
MNHRSAPGLPPGRTVGCLKPYTLHPAPYTLHPAPCTLHPAPCTLHPAPCTLHPNPSTRSPWTAKPGDLSHVPCSVLCALSIIFTESTTFTDDRLKWLAQRLEGVPREQKMLKGHLPGVIYHQVY